MGGTGVSNTKVEAFDVEDGMGSTLSNHSDEKLCATSQLTSKEAQSQGPDVEALINNLIIVSALLLGFTITLSASFKHEDFVAADSRLVAFVFSNLDHCHSDTQACDLLSRAAGYRLDCKNQICPFKPKEVLFSYGFANNSMWSTLLFTAVLLLGLCTSISRAFLGSCSQKEKKIWTRCFAPVLFCSYLLLIAGVCVFFGLNHAAMEIIYPRYDDSTGSSFFNFSTETMIENYGSYSFIMDQQSHFSKAFVSLSVIIPVLTLLLHLWLLGRVHTPRLDTQSVSNSTGTGC
jgi:hypothetical protein